MKPGTEYKAGDEVSAGNLNAHVADAILEASDFAERTLKATPVADDLVFISDSADPIGGKAPATLTRSAQWLAPNLPN